MSNPPPEENPLLSGGNGPPAFDQIRPEHVQPAVQQLLEETTTGLELIEARLEDSTTATWNNTIDALEALDRQWEHTWSPVTHLMGVKNSDELRTAHESVLADVVAMGLRMKQSRPLHEALCHIRDDVTLWNQLDEAQQRVISKQLLDATLAGIALNDHDQERFNAIAERLSQLATDFSNHVLDATKQWELVLTDANHVEGLPSTLKQLASQSYNDAADDATAAGDVDSGPWRFTLDAPSAMPFLQHCRVPDLREQLYQAFTTRASDGEFDNSTLIDEILELRHERAALLGFSTFAEMSVATKMADVASVESMFEQLRQAAWGAGQSDLKDLQDLAADSGQPQPLCHWDLPFWAERLREKRFDLNDELIRPYFPLERVLDGLFELAGHLFGIDVVAADGQVPVWHEDVRYFRIRDEAGQPIAAFYLDPYSRPQDKRGGAWMDDCLSRRIIDGQLQLPVAHLVCNGTPPVGQQPSLMTFREVETLFHEFGHGLQHMLTTVDYADASGISGVEWDAVELPSQFMENWCYHRTTLMGIARHYQTGEPLPDEIFDNLRRARTYRAGSLMLRQLNFGMLDLYLHHQYDPASDETVLEAQQRIAANTSPLTPLPENRFLCSFQHIFAGGYAAGYYSYKWAEVLSADAYSAFEDAGLDDPEAVAQTGRRFRDTVLASGGGRHPMDVFRDFRGREPSTDALLRHNGLV